MQTHPSFVFWSMEKQGHPIVKLHSEYSKVETQGNEACSICDVYERIDYD